MITANLEQSFQFDSAHTLARDVPLEQYTPSTRVHGHTYTAVVTVTGDLVDGMIALKRPGWKREHLDLHLLGIEIARVRESLDHRLLDDVEGLGRATLENLCVFIGEQLRLRHIPVSKVAVGRASGDRAWVAFG